MAAAVNPKLEAAARDFLAQKRIAVAGVSRSGNAVGNAILKKLDETGHEVFAVNPHAETIDGHRCYPNVGSIPVQVDGVVVTTAPEATPDIARACVEAGIPRLWIHRSFGQGSMSDEGVQIARKAGIKIIPGACPMMFCEPVDLGHKCFRWWFGMRGKLPEAGDLAAK